MKEVIKIIAEHENETHNLETVAYGYRSLMHLIFDKIYIEGFGDCGGMGRCGTCLVEALNREYTSKDFDRNELSTLKKLGNTTPNTRLACQLMIDEKINDLHCKIILPESVDY